MYKPDRVGFRECFKTLSRVYFIVEDYVEKLSVEQQIEKNDLGDNQVPITPRYAYIINNEETIENERIRNSQAKEMRKHRPKQLKRMKKYTEGQEWKPI